MRTFVKEIRQRVGTMLEAAGIASDGLAGAVRQNGLLAIHYAVSRVFDKDDTADLSKTMAALDSRLKSAEKWSQTIDKYVKNPVSRRPDPEPDSPAP